MKGKNEDRTALRELEGAWWPTEHVLFYFLFIKLCLLIN